jgi:hypothetical protein
MMTCSTLSNPEDMKPLLRDAITLITPSDQAEDEYAALQLCLALGEHGAPGAYLLLGLSPGSKYHMCLRYILLVQPNSSADSSAGPQPWYPSPFLVNPDGVSLEGQWDTHTPQEVATFLKAAYRPAQQPGKTTQDLQWIITTLTAPHMDDTLPRY